MKYSANSVLVNNRLFNIKRRSNEEFSEEL